MRRAARTAVHAGLLAGLVAGEVSGVATLAGYLVMLVAAPFGGMPAPAPELAGLIFGIVMALLWGTVILAGLGALRRQTRRSVALARWVAASRRTPTARLAAAAAWATMPDRVARTWSAAFFLVPLVGALLQRLLDRQELKADRAAVDSCGVSPVAGALLKAVGRPVVPGGALAAMSEPGLLEARVSQLETGGCPLLHPAFNRAAVLASLPGLTLVALYGVLLYQVCLAAGTCCAT